MRRFGVELEFTGSVDDAIAAIQAAGVPVEDRRNYHYGNSNTHWQVKFDSTVQGGGELVSPPLDFDDPAQREQVTKAVQALQDAGCRPDSRAGIHVHIEAKNFDGTPLSGKQLAAIARFFYKFEDALYRIASSGWASIRPGARTYAKPIPDDVARRIMKVRTVDELKNVWDGYTHCGRRVAGPYYREQCNRYHAVNYHSYWLRNTIEFRLFNSSVNPMRVQTYIALCMAVVDDARHGYSRSVKKSYPLGSMVAGNVTEKALFLRLQQVLRTNSKDTKVLMSKEDWKNLRVLWSKDSRAQSDIFAT